MDDRWRKQKKVLDQTFLDEELGLKRDPSRTRDYTWS
jgi:hypothetical protein